MSTELEPRFRPTFPSESTPEPAGSATARLGQRQSRRRTTAAALRSIGTDDMSADERTDDVH